MEAQRFSYARSLAPLVWALVAVALVEAALVHLLVGLMWSGYAALVLTGVTAAGLMWLVLFVRSFRTLPVLIDGDAIVMRVGRLRSIRFARGDVRAVGGEIDAAALRQPSVLKLSLLAHPNIVVDLAAPVPVGRRLIERVAHRLDDPAAFTAALRDGGRTG